MAFIVIGGLNFDIVLKTDRFPVPHEKMSAFERYEGPGGSAPNTAYWLGKLGCETIFHGELADDHFASLSIESLRSASVGTSHLKVSAGTDSRLAVIISTGESKMMISSGGPRRPDQAIRECLGSADAPEPGDIVHITSRHFAGAEDYIAGAQAQGAIISVELNGAHPERFAALCDFMFCNEDELQRALGTDDVIECVQGLMDRSDATLVVTRGASGACVIGGKHAPIHIPTAAVRPIDRTGGGDAFNAGFLSALARNAQVEEAAAKGLELAAKVILHNGARPALKG
ncbi:carbohydrate kinase family protein [Citromicrobium bathyomarinum]|uniref:carbohydrate kinase family protein n=1 Tax=Citromicrobium bathyomarinum TaxID=72174 RepID=UPI00315A1C89